MSIFPFESLEALQLFLSQSSKEQFQEALPHFSLTELAECLNLLQVQPTLEAKDKIEILFQWIDSPTTLESLGKKFSLLSFTSFLEFLAQHPEHQNRLSFILIGLDPVIFSQALHVLQNSQLNILKQGGLLEPLQYQLTQFAHEGEALKKQMEQSFQQFQQELLYIHPDELTQTMLQSLIHKIDHFRNQFLDYLERASAALAIVWHTDRVDLIEKVSSVNEMIQYQLTHFIGHPAFDSQNATGLYAMLEKTFSNIFDSSLNDDDSAIEGMTRLSIWHLKDYWELGLLPSVQDPKALDGDPQKQNEQEHWIYQQRLVVIVQQQLERLGIGKVKDLKKSHLYSKPLLKTFIEKHRHLLIEN